MGVHGSHISLWVNTLKLNTIYIHRVTISMVKNIRKHLAFEHGDRTPYEFLRNMYGMTSDPMFDRDGDPPRTYCLIGMSLAAKYFHQQ